MAKRTTVKRHIRRTNKGRSEVRKHLRQVKDKRYYILYPKSSNKDKTIKVVSRINTKEMKDKYGFAEGAYHSHDEVVIRLNWMDIPNSQRPTSYQHLEGNIKHTPSEIEKRRIEDFLSNTDPYKSYYYDGKNLVVYHQDIVDLSDKPNISYGELDELQRKQPTEKRVYSKEEVGL